MSLTVTTRSPEQTQELGRALGRTITAGPLLLLLSGDYGTGKTTFVQALAAGMGVSETMRSPSYLLARAYGTERCTLVHADLYRVGSAAEAADLGLDELAGADGVVAVEWPGAAAELALRGWPVLRLAFSADADAADTRHIELSWSADCPGAVAAVLEEMDATAAR